MSDFIEFEDLKIGNYAKISGKQLNGAGFLAVEVSVEPSQGDDKLESILQEVDLPRKRIKVLGQDMPLDEVEEIRNLNDSNEDLTALKPGLMVKIKGEFDQHKGFIPEKLRLKEPQEFNIEELQGTISHIDSDEKKIVVNGIDIRINHRTILLKV